MRRYVGLQGHDKVRYSTHGLIVNLRKHSSLQTVRVINSFAADGDCSRHRSSAVGDGNRCIYKC